MVNKKELYDNVRMVETKDTTLSVLSYYGIPVVKNGILCPFHMDAHYGSCSFIKDSGLLKCFSCGEVFGAVKIIQKQKSLDYFEACKVLWVDILGRVLPEYENKEEQKKEQGKYLSYKELKQIGLGCAPEKKPIVYENLCRKEEVPPGWINSGVTENAFSMCDGNVVMDEYYVCGKQENWDIKALPYEEYIALVYGKANEKIEEIKEKRAFLFEMNEKIKNEIPSKKEALSPDDPGYCDFLIKKENIRGWRECKKNNTAEFIEVLAILKKIKKAMRDYHVQLDNGLCGIG